jgi:putative ABC transport system permease protein
MKGKTGGSLAASSLRKGLVVFQFIISVMLIVASVVINRQMTFVRKADLGFAKDRQLVVPLRSTTAQKLFPTFKTMLAADPRILSTSGSSAYPGIDNPSDQVLYAEGKTVNDAYDVKLNYTDFDFLKTLDVQPVAGRLFSNRFPTDSVDGIVINQRAVKEMGYTVGNAVGKKVYASFQGQTQAYRIIGVVKDFHFEDLHVLIDAYGVMVNSAFDHFNYLIVHLSPGDPAPVIASIQRTWKRLNPGEPFEYTFLDQQFQKNYDADTRLADIVGYFTAIAIAISCLGLLGLAAFSAEQRTKEIGIRKVLGASPAGIVVMLSGDFIKLVILSIAVASPLAWLAMRRWLQDFAYKTTIDWTVFALTALAAVFIAVVTISTQAVRAATSSPVKSLRSE